MKFPTATIILVSAALIYVAWDMTRDKPAPTDAGRFADVAANPVERGEVVDWVVSRIPEHCEDTTGESAGSQAHFECVERSESRNSLCRRAIYDTFPDRIHSDTVFRDVALTMMDCLAQR